MSFFIFLKNPDNSDNFENKIYKIAENQSDLNNLNINLSEYKIVEDSQDNFNLVKYGIKFPSNYFNNSITYVDNRINYFDTITFLLDKKNLQTYISDFKIMIKYFTDNNPTHILYSRWTNYYNQLNSVNIDSIILPSNTSLESYFNNTQQPSFHYLQIP